MAMGWLRIIEGLQSEPKKAEARGSAQPGP